MQFRIRCALAATALSAAALAAAPAAQAQPTVCGTAGFKALDTAVNHNPSGFAGLLGFTYRFARPQSAAAFDTLAQCDLSAAKSVWGAFKVQNPNEAADFKAYFTGQYPTDASRVFGVIIIIS